MQIIQVYIDIFLLLVKAFNFVHSLIIIIIIIIFIEIHIL